MYITLEGAIAELQQDLYDAAEIGNDLIDIDAMKVIPWIDAAAGTSFIESDLTGDDSLIRLAACKYGAYSMMSSALEGHNIEDVSLALHRLGEAKEYVKMWCHSHGVVPSFIDEAYSPYSAAYAVATGTDGNCIG